MLFLTTLEHYEASKTFQVPVWGPITAVEKHKDRGMFEMYLQNDITSKHISDFL